MMSESNIKSGGDDGLWGDPNNLTPIPRSTMKWLALASRDLGCAMACREDSSVDTLRNVESAERWIRQFHADLGKGPNSNNL